MMKDIKKKIVTTSLGAMVLASGLTGCNSNTKQASNDEKSNITTEATTLEQLEETTIWSFEERDYFKGKPVERQGRKARRD
mgnify:CR=1 FL=1